MYTQYLGTTHIHIINEFYNFYVECIPYLKYLCMLTKCQLFMNNHK